ncbi:substrate-binding domain-containing protein [Cupriavidus basilensis]
MVMRLAVDHLLALGHRRIRPYRRSGFVVHRAPAESWALRFTPPLTTIRIAVHEMGAKAATLLLARIEGAGAEAASVVRCARADRARVDGTAGGLTAVSQVYSPGGAMATCQRGGQSGPISAATRCPT